MNNTQVFQTKFSKVLLAFWNGFIPAKLEM